MKKTILMTILGLVVFLAGCTVVPKTSQEKAVLDAEVQEAIAVFKANDSSIAGFFNQSYGYAVLPKVLKGGFWVGGAHGRGEVFEHSYLLGYCNMTQATIGLTFGGQFFREIIFFETKADLQKFQTKEYAFSAEVNAVAITAGAAAKARYRNGMAVFVMPEKGLMVDASVGGQKFSFVPRYVP